MKTNALHVFAAVALASVPALAQAKPPVVPAQTKASAAPAESGNLDEARQRFQRGVELYKEGSFDAALAEFDKAYELAPNYRVLFNIAQVQNERHDYVAALDDFQKYLDQGGAEISQDRRDQVNREIAALKGRVAPLTVTADVEGAELLVDGAVVGTLPLSQPVMVSAGIRQIQVRKPGYQTSSRSETIAGGDAVNLDVKLEAIPVSQRPTTIATTPPVFSSGSEEEHPAPEHVSRAPFWITLASTAVLTGGAITFGVLAHNADQNLDGELGKFPGNPSAIDSARSTLKRDALISDILTAGAVVSGGFCIYFAIAGAHGSSSEASGTSLRVAASGSGIHLLGRF